jgi:murein DD-endopeptidase MepM/ murein hydrolase activator NlpD
MTSKYGWRDNPFMPGTQQFHYGIDLGCYEGTPVLATKDGVVTHADYDAGYGNRVDISHAGGWLSIYGHNNRILVKVGQVVHKGDIIALSGNTGASTGPHVHYELHKDGTPIDPNTVLAVKLY